METTVPISLGSCKDHTDGILQKCSEPCCSNDKTRHLLTPMLVTLTLQVGQLSDGGQNYSKILRWKNSDNSDIDICDELSI